MAGKALKNRELSRIVGPEANPANEERPLVKAQRKKPAAALIRMLAGRPFAC